MPRYDDVFFDYVTAGARRSAEVVVPLLRRELDVGSVLDVGCGLGAWLAVWQDHGVAEIVGLDGAYVDPAALVIPRRAFVAHDLSRGFDLGRRFDLVQSLEVGEHLPAARAAAFVDALVGHGDLVVFSAAPPGQGGDHHVNEREYDYWRAHFARHGYVAIDWVRPLIAHDGRIDPWYRYNIILYASPGRFRTLSPAVQGHRVADDETLRDVSPSFYRTRKALVRRLPVSVVTAAAKLKERLVARARALPGRGCSRAGVL